MFVINCIDYWQIISGFFNIPLQHSFCITSVISLKWQEISEYRLSVKNDISPSQEKKYIPPPRIRPLLIFRVYVNQIHGNKMLSTYIAAT